jgi:FKBP-type peptidyl-prolyl cis-trans isomerase FklB
MNVRSLSAVLTIVVLSACNQVTGQKDRGAVVLNTMTDSVSYGIGTDLGHNMRMSGLDSLNVDAMALGIRDGLDSNEQMTTEQVRTLVQTYMLGAQQKMMAREQAEAETNLRTGEAWLMENGKKPGVQTTASGLQYEVLQMGTGPKPTAADQVKVHYKGNLLNGTEFDSSYKRNEPAVFGVGNVIPGWTEALTLMPAGSRWKLYIPANLAYGTSRGPGGELPPNSMLLFEVELLDVLGATPK